MKKSEINETRNGHKYLVDPRNIVFVFNKRRKENFEIESILDSVIANGVLQPITCFKIAGTETYGLIDGERRVRTALKAIEMGQGEKCQYIETITKPKPSDIDYRYEILVRNADQKPLTDLEQAETFKELKELGCSVEDISKRIGKSVVHVRNLLKFVADASPEVKEAIAKKDISTSQVINIGKSIKKDADLNKVVADVVEKKKESKQKTSDKKETAKVKDVPVELLKEKKPKATIQKNDDFLAEKSETKVCPVPDKKIIKNAIQHDDIPYNDVIAMLDCIKELFDDKDTKCKIDVVAKEFLEN